MFRGSDSSVREHFDAVAQTNRADFASVVAEWKALAHELRDEVKAQDERIGRMQDEIEELMSRELECKAVQREQGARIKRLELLLKQSGYDMQTLSDG